MSDVEEKKSTLKIIIEIIIAVLQAIFPFVNIKKK